MAGQPGAEPPAARLTGPHEHRFTLDRRRADGQARFWRLSVPAEQQLQFRSCVGQHLGHLIDERFERTVAAHDQPLLVVDQHAGAAEIEPLRQFVLGAAGLRAGGDFGADLVPQNQAERRPFGRRQFDHCDHRPALAALRVQQPPRQLRRPRLAGCQGGATLGARGNDRGVILGWRPCQHIAAGQRAVRPAHQFEVGLVGIDQSLVGILQGGRRRCGPQRAQQRVGVRCGAAFRCQAGVRCAAL